jgi:hypothetical protein
MAKKIKKKPSSSPFSSSHAPSTRRDIAAYAMTRLFEDPRFLKGLNAKDLKNTKSRFTPSKVDALSTDEIVERLRALGVDIDEAELRRRAVGHRSAWDVSRGFDLHLDRDDDDFLGLAICVLWKRWHADQPSAEMIDDWIIEGYGCSARHEHDRGLSTWRKAWDALRVAIGKDATTIDDAEEIAFTGLSSLLNWTQEYVEEHIHVSPEHVEDGIKLIDELLEQFSAENELFRQNLMMDKSTIFEIADRIDDAERAARAIIDAWPTKAIGYATLASVAEKAKRKRDAIAVIEQALAVPVDDADDFDLSWRLEYLREHPDGEPDPASPP